jgi:Cysteine-rich secretory protein family
MKFRRILLLLLALVAGLGASVLPARPAAAAEADPTAAADQFFALLNQVRAANGKAAVVRDRGLDGVAQQWSGTMASTNNFSHRTNLAAAAASVEPNWRGVAENIANGGSDAVFVQTLHDMLVKSPGHFANMIGDYNRAGIGVVLSNGRMWVTQNFLLGPSIAPPPPPPPVIEPAPRTWNPASLLAVNPVRLIDTRRTGRIGANSTFSVRPASTVAASAGSEAITVNLTVVDAAADGYATVWPCGSDRPGASSLNFDAGDTRANTITVALGGGEMCVFTTAPGHFLVDLTGYHQSGAGQRYTPLTPSRLLDTRGAGRTQRARFTVAGGASAAALNLTVTEPSNGGYITVWPCDQAQPNASSLNFGPGETVANMAITKVAGNGEVCLFASVPTHLLADLQGTYSGSGAQLVAADPRRAVDTRTGVGGKYGLMPADTRQPLAVNLKQLGRVAGNANGVVMNITVTSPMGGGWLAVYPCDAGLPNASNLNFSAGQTVANGVMSKLDGQGRICIATSQATHVIADVTGWLA